MQIDSPFPVLDIFDSYLGGLVVEYADTANLQTPDDFINGDPIDLGTMIVLVTRINSLIENMQNSTNPEDQQAVNSPQFQSMINLLNQQVGGNQSLISAAVNNNQEEFAEDILSDKANGYPMLHSIQIFLAYFPNNNL